MPSPRKDFWGFMAMAFSLYMVLGGMPTQIWAIYAAKSVSALSIQFFTCGLFSSISWLIRGIRNGDKYIVLPQIPAIIFSVVIVGQIAYYR